VELIFEGDFIKKKPNQLINGKSSYLLQHAYNLVDWHPWGDEAFEKAKREDEPVSVVDKFKKKQNFREKIN